MKKLFLSMMTIAGVFTALESSAQQSNAPLWPGAPLMPTNAEKIEAAFKTPPGFVGDDWKVYRTEWTTADEQEFSNFIVAISQSGCRTVDTCIKGAWNPYYNEALEKDIYIYADCGRSPMFFRAYFSWKKGLPFSFVDKKTGTPEDMEAWRLKEIAKGNLEPDMRLFRTQSSPSGNIMLRRADIPNATTRRYRFYETMRLMMWKVESGNYRFDSARPMPVLPDFYPVEVQRGSIRPGTIYYEPNGHILMVSEIMANGGVRFIDSHPGNSVSRPMFGVNHERSRPSMGPGFKNFRPVRLVGARQMKDGSYIGGQVIPFADAELPDFSIRQMIGTKPDPAGVWKNGSFIVEGMQVGFHEWVKLSLSQGALAVNPLEQFRIDLESFCTDIQTRAKDVQEAVTEGYFSKPHPEMLPSDIHSGLETVPDWEPMSTPGRDRRTRLSGQGLVNSVRTYVQRVNLNSSLIDYRGTNILADLTTVAQKVSAACQISYLNSQGQPVALNLLDVVRRLPKMSFDHYHCPERRWGATSPEELRTCADDATKTAWYQSQQVFRNKLDTTPLFDDPFNLSALQLKNSQRPQPDLSFDLEKALRGGK